MAEAANTAMEGVTDVAMHTSHPGMSVRLKGSEYVCDIDVAIGQFTSRSFEINAGLEKVFANLSQIAACYEQYRFNGLMFEFRSTSSDSVSSISGNLAIGSVLMRVDYNVNSPAATTKGEFLNSMGAKSFRPSDRCLIGVECDNTMNPTSVFYTRTGAVDDSKQAQDLRLYDLARLEIASSEASAAYTAGTLHVHYDVTLFKMQNVSANALTQKCAHYQLNGVTNTAQLGSSQTKSFDSLGIDFPSADIVRLPENASGKYLFIMSVTGSSTASLAFPTLGGTNLSYGSIFANDTAASIALRNAPTSTNTFTTTIWTVDDPGERAFWTVETSGTKIPTSPTSADLFVIQVNGGLV